MWELSHKYTTHLVNQLKSNDNLLNISLGIYKQFLSELQSRGFVIKKNNKIMTSKNSTSPKSSNQEKEIGHIKYSYEESFKREKFLESKPENNTEATDDIDENLDQNSADKVLDESSDETKIQKTAKTQVEVN